MKTPYYSNNQFIDQGVGNAAAAMVTDSIEDVAAALYSPGLINAGDVSLSYTGTNVVNVSAPLPFRVLFGSGVLASANGTVNGQQSSNASVDFSSVIPTSGTVTAYMVASASTVQQGAYQVVGPPVGHPDYNANFNPYTAYNETQDTLLFTATTTVPDNVTYIEVCRVTLTAGQTQITAANVSTAYQVLAAPTGGTRTVQGNETVTGELIVGGAATVGGTLGVTGAVTVPNATAAQNPVTLTQVQNDGVVTGSGIAGATITGGNIASGTVTGGNIAGSTITGGNIGSGTITGGNIAGSTITGGNIGSGTITGGNIAGSTITEGNIAGGAIHRAQLSTATASGSIGTGTSGWNGTYTLSGGNYSWATPSASNYNNTNPDLDTFVVFGAPGQGQGVLGVAVYGGGSVDLTFYIQENYINSSPPYNFGEAFVYVAYDKDGKIVGISAALDPTWAHHGPHSIVPTHRSKSGKPLVYQDMLDGVIFSEAMKDKARRLAYLKGELIKERGEVEITVDYKDTDMHTHPHPFGSDSVARVVLMHPDSACNNGLVNMLKAGHAAEIVKMIEDGDLIPGTDLISHPYSPIPTVKFKLR